MKKLVIIADTHHRTENLQSLIPLINSADTVVHLGDYTDDIERFKEDITAETLIIRGNCDFFSTYPEESVLTLGAHKILFTHGHQYGVKSGNLSRLSAHAASKGCTYAFYGHSHTANTGFLNGVCCINPGSLSKPRTGLPSYCLVELNEDGTLNTQILNP